MTNVRKFGVISDAHGNGSAFKIALNALQKVGVSDIYYLGDAIGYIPSLSVLDIIKHRGDINCILGNHEKMFLSDQLDPKLDDVYLFSKIRKKYLTEFNGIIESWNDFINIKIGDFSILMIHGSPNDHTYGYVYPDSDLSVFDCDKYNYIFMGNTHRPFIRNHNNVNFINVGSCGLPRDHGHYGSAAIFDPNLGKCEIIRFDIQTTITEIEAKYPDIHQSVKNLFKRKSNSIYGDLVC